ncbi:AMP-binding protein [Streptomyces sp. NPDC048442]|uniref:AMP-binding protein n=1 Tax=Streptomyces sp. NPDC048442 TaxID=3154823 RepID=UPI0034289518
MTNLATDLKTAAERYPEQPAVRLDDGFLSFAALDELSARVAGGLLAHGVRPGDPVALLLPNVPALSVLYFGVLRIGAVVVSPGSLFDVRRLRECVDGARAPLFFAAHETEARLAHGSRAMCVPVGQSFLDQVAFWPEHTKVTYRSDEDTAVSVGAGERVGMAAGTELTHGALRAQSCVASVSLGGLMPHGAEREGPPGTCVPFGRRPARCADDNTGADAGNFAAAASSGTAWSGR